MAKEGERERRVGRDGERRKEEIGWVGGGEKKSEGVR